MSEVVFFVEDRSMREFLNGLLPRFFPSLRFRLITHEGKADLDRSVGKKLRAWRTPGTRFVVLRDQDAAECEAVKQHLVTLCERAGKPGAVVRIACRELEAWYLGDPHAMAVAFNDPKLARLAAKAQFRNPDTIGNPSQMIGKLVPGFGKVAVARVMSGCLGREGNRSSSFRVFLEGVDRAMGHTHCPR